MYLLFRDPAACWVLVYLNRVTAVVVNHYCLDWISCDTRQMADVKLLVHVSILCSSNFIGGILQVCHWIHTLPKCALLCHSHWNLASSPVPLQLHFLTCIVDFELNKEKHSSLSSKVKYAAKNMELERASGQSYLEPSSFVSRISTTFKLLCL